MVKLSNSVRTNVAESFEMQTIARMDQEELIKSQGSDNDLVQRFINLASENFSFVDSWDDNLITSSTFRAYSKKVPVAEASRLYVSKVRQEFRHLPAGNLRERKCYDTFKMNNSRTAFREATSDISRIISQKCKVPETLLFFKGAVFECTFNCPKDSFLNADPVFMFNIPSATDLEDWKKIKVLKFPPGWSDFSVDPGRPYSYYVEEGFKEIDIPVGPEYTIGNGTMQCLRKQYGIRHRITGTFHGSMGDTYESMASEISNTNPDYGLWDRGQLVVLISRTKVPNKTIFVGPKHETLQTLKSVLTKRTQWTNFITAILNVITVNEAPVHGRILSPESFPFRISDMRLPETDQGIVYMLNSLKRRSFTYIGKTKHPRSRLQNHNSGFGSSSTEPTHLRPFAVMAYITGFGGNDHLMLAAEQKWKRCRDDLIRNGEMDPKTWARAGGRVIEDRTLHQNYNVEPHDLRMVILFHDEDD
jgi:predicted GIY-YIG superfamily endonuclease